MSHREHQELHERALFIWIPKAAGNSIWYTLKDNLQDRTCQYLQDNPRAFSPSKWMTCFAHNGSSALLREKIIDTEYLERSFKFAFVRNPWDRMVSLFHYLRERYPHELGGIRTFPSFIERVASGDIPPVDLYNVKGLSQANSQLDWLRHEDVFLPDFVGRFETLHEDWCTLCKMLGIPAPPLPHKQKSSHSFYRNYYDTKLRELVAKRFAEEIDFFGYTF